MNHYLAYGLHIKSNLYLPELSKASSTEPPDLRIRKGAVDSPSGESTDTHRRISVCDGFVFLDYPGVGSFRIQNGSEIIVDPVSTGDPLVRRVHILGPALGVALHQRNRLVLHASAVAIGGQAVVFLGESHSGKSTIGASIAEAGYDLLVDDVTAVERNAGLFCLTPGYPYVKLQPETADALGWKRSKTAKADDSSMAKAHYPVPNTPASDSYPISRIYLLADGNEPMVETMSPPDATAALYRHFYCRELCERTGDQETLLERFGALVSETTVKRLFRPRDFDRLADVIECIEADVGA